MTATRTTGVKNVVVLLLPPLAVTGAFWLTRVNDVSLLEFLGGLALLLVAWGSYRKWRARASSSVPLFPMLATMYWIYYVPPLHWGNRRHPIGMAARVISDASLQSAILMALLGVVCLWLGMRLKLGRRLVPRKILDLHAADYSSWHYVRAILVLASLFALYAGSTRLDMLGQGGRQVIALFTTAIPTTAFVLLFRRFLQGRADPIEKLLLVGFAAIKFVTGMSSGWLGTVATLVVICGAVYIYERRKLPVLAIALLVPYVLFFQVGKEEFRKTFWGTRVDATAVERISYWSAQSLSHWQSALEDPSGDSWHDLAQASLGRVSLVYQAGNVLDMTPSQVPFQYGHLYSYMLVTLIPRALWPDKPSVNDANRFYQVAYGLTDPDNLQGVSISVGTLTESYINFGWAGVFLIMISLGIFFDFFQHTFLSEDSGLVFNAIGIALIPNFIAIEAQMAEYVGGLVQAIVLILLVLLPVLHATKRGRSDSVARRPSQDDYHLWRGRYAPARPPTRPL